ncbi:unnamed protein product [Prunus armeniaca]
MRSPSTSPSSEPQGFSFVHSISQKKKNIAGINQSLSLWLENQKSISSFSLLHSLQHSQAFARFQPNHTSVVGCVRTPNRYRAETTRANHSELPNPRQAEEGCRSKRRQSAHKLKGQNCTKP